MCRLNNTVAVITGGNRGIGKAMATLFAAEGAKLALCARNADLLEQTATELQGQGTDVLAQPADVSDETAVRSFFNAVVDRFGRIDLLVNNACGFDDSRIDELTLEDWHRVTGTGLTGAFLCTREAFRLMKQQGGGRILNVGSISAQRPRESNAAYAAAKFGIWGLTQATALDGRPFGIICSCLHPGNVLVERRQSPPVASGGDGHPDEEPMMTSETIARAALAMVTVPPDVNFLQAIVLPRDQLYLGRG